MLFFPFLSFLFFFFPFLSFSFSFFFSRPSHPENSDVLYGANADPLHDENNINKNGQDIERVKFYTNVLFNNLGFSTREFLVIFVFLFIYFLFIYLFYFVRIFIIIIFFRVFVYLFVISLFWFYCVCLFIYNNIGLSALTSFIHVGLGYVLCHFENVR